MKATSAENNTITPVEKARACKNLIINPPIKTRLPGRVYNVKLEMAVGYARREYFDASWWIGPVHRIGVARAVEMV